jgi:hypothetical protein
MGQSVERAKTIRLPLRPHAHAHDRARLSSPNDEARMTNDEGMTKTESGKSLRIGNFDADDKELAPKARLGLGARLPACWRRSLPAHS